MTDSTAALYTIGYEGRSLEDLIAGLAAAGIGMVLDVRDAPFSRKPGFSKQPLAEALAAAGIGYVHLPGLGNPKQGREAARGGDTETYRRELFGRLAGATGRRDLARAAEIAERTPACLLCFEADPAHCHRSLVAQEIVGRTGQRIDDLRLAKAERSGDAGAGQQLAFGFDGPESP